MAIQEHAEIIRQGVAEWNAWRFKHGSVKPDLSGLDLTRASLADANFRETNLSDCTLENAFCPRADFFKAELQRANFVKADLVLANLSSAKLQHANLSGANLIEADLADADLSHANLREANLYKAILTSTKARFAQLQAANLSFSNLMDADFSGADLSDANLAVANLLRSDLRGSNLSRCWVHGASVWRIQVDSETRQQDLVITDYSEPRITIDDLEVAQFIYLLLNHQKLRNMIDSITKRGVLLLGRFGGGGIDVLRAVAEELRKLTYSPIIFDFDRPQDRNLTETVQILVGLSRFVVVDLSGPSVPQELYATVPHFQVPYIPIIEEPRKPYAMSKDILEYSWVVKPIVRFSSIDELRARVLEGIVAPAESMVEARRIARHST